jgi:hypothetical protein
MDAEAQKMHKQKERKERKEFQLQQAKEKVFLDEQKCKVPVEDLETEDAELGEEQGHCKRNPCALWRSHNYTG